MGESDIVKDFLIESYENNFLESFAAPWYAERSARNSAPADFEKAYAAGLLHDVGFLVTASRFPTSS
jgi:HD-like signal output (HDOD) protein